MPALNFSVENKVDSFTRDAEAHKPSRKQWRADAEFVFVMFSLGLLLLTAAAYHESIRAFLHI